MGVRLVCRPGIAIVGEDDDRLGCGCEAGRRKPRHCRRAAAQESDMAQRIALESDRTAAVASRLHRLPEGGRDVAELRLQPVADAAQPVDPRIGRRVGFGMADHDRRRVRAGVRHHDAVEPFLVEAHVVTLHVAPGAGAADVDPPVERAHRAPRRGWTRMGTPPGVRKRWIAAPCARYRSAAPRAGWQVGDGAFRAFMARTMPRAGSPVHRTMVRGVGRALRRRYLPLMPLLRVDWDHLNSTICRDARAHAHRNSSRLRPR